MQELAINIGTAIILGSILDMVLESLIFLSAFSYLRTYAGGYHCKKFSSCYILSNVLIVMVLFITKYIDLDILPLFNVIIFLICIPILVKFAPTSSSFRSLDRTEYVYFKKITIRHMSILCALMMICFWGDFKAESFLIGMAIFICSSSVLWQKIIMIIHHQMNVKEYPIQK